MKVKIDLIFLLALFLFVFRGFLGTGVRVANDFPFVSQDSLKSGLSLPQTWSRTGENFGEYMVSTLWSWPLDFLYGVGASLGIEFSILERIFGVFLFLIVGIFSIRKFLNELEVGKYAKFIASFFYLANPFVLLLIDGGQFQIALAYAFFPLAYILVLKGIRGKVNEKLVSGLAVSLLGFTDIRFVYILGILLFLKFFYEAIFLRREEVFTYLLGWIKTGITISIVFVGLNFYWILPAVLVKAPALPATYQRVSQTSFLSFASLGHSLFLLQPHWYKNVFGKVTPLLAEFVFIPLLVFLAPVLRKKDKSVGFWLIVALVGIFLVKGNNPPLSWVYPWLFTHIPGFSFFRDPTKFFFLVSVSYSVLIGVTVDELLKRIPRILAYYHATVRGSNERISNRLSGYSGSVVLGIIILYLLYLTNPVWLGKMTGTFSKPAYQVEYEKLTKVLESDKNFSRVFWIPTKAPLGYSSLIHPSVEASRFAEKRPFAIGTVGTYEIFNFLREAPFMGEIFDIAGIKYLAYPYPDTRREELKQDNIDYYYAFLNQITSLPWVEGKLTEPPAPLLKIKGSQDHFFLPQNTFLIVGSDGIYNELLKIDSFKLSENALIFAEEKPGLGGECRVGVCRVLLYDKGEMDFAVTFIDKERFIFPAQYLDFDPKPTKESGKPGWVASRSLGEGWWKRETFDFLWMRNFLQQKYGIDNTDFDYAGGYAISEGNNSKFIIHNSKFQKDNILLARVMRSGAGGRIEFLQEDKKIGEIVTKVENPEKVVIKLTGYKDIPDKISLFDKADFSWFEVGELTSDRPLTIKTFGDINIVNALAIIPKNEWLEIKGLIDNYQIIRWDKLSIGEKKGLFNLQSTARIKYTKISPTHYKVRLEGLVRPTTLAFSEGYDPLWQANGSSSLPLYSLINGFYIEKDGEYDIYFSAQKHILPGVWVSGLSFAFILFLIFVEKREKLI